jgi:hypothetical protein
VLLLVVDGGGSEASRWNWRKRADGHGSRSRWRRQGSLDRGYVRRKLGFTYGVSFGSGSIYLWLYPFVGRLLVILLGLMSSVQLGLQSWKVRNLFVAVSKYLIEIWFAEHIRTGKSGNCAEYYAPRLFCLICL